MKNLFNRFVKEEAGQDMVEYVLILAFVAVGAAAIITGVGGDLKSVWQATSSHAANAASAAGTTSGS